MLEIAGGILIAVAILVVVLCFWDTLLIGAVLAIGLAIMGGVWVFLASMIGSGWATAAIAGAGAGLWGFNALQDSEWSERRIRKAAEQKKKTPYNLSDSIGFSLIILSFAGVLSTIFLMSLGQLGDKWEDSIILSSLIAIPILLIFITRWHYNRFVKNYGNEEYEESNLFLIAWGKSLAIFLISLVFIPMIMISVVSGINANWGESGFALWITALAALALCAVIARSVYCDVIQKALPSVGEN